MKLLVDTIVFIWLVQQEPIPPRVLTQLKDPFNDLYVSVVTPWEMQIKVGVGKLKFSETVISIVQTQLSLSSMTLLPISLAVGSDRGGRVGPRGREHRVAGNRLGQRHDRRRAGGVGTAGGRTGPGRLKGGGD
jgi:hypothetical protein